MSCSSFSQIYVCMSYVRYSIFFVADCCILRVPIPPIPAHHFVRWNVNYWCHIPSSKLWERWMYLNIWIRWKERTRQYEDLKGGKKSRDKDKTTKSIDNCCVWYYLCLNLRSGCDVSPFRFLEIIWLYIISKYCSSLSDAILKVYQDGAVLLRRRGSLRQLHLHKQQTEAKVAHPKETTRPW